MATVQAIYGLARRQTQGFLQPVFELMKLGLPAPDHSTLLRRKRQLTIILPVKAERHVCDENLRRIRKVGRKQWKRESNYHRRSLPETQDFRFKTIFSDRLESRQIDNQFKELMLKSAILNRMTHLGSPIASKSVDNKSLKARIQYSCNKALSKRKMQ